MSAVSDPVEPSSRDKDEAGHQLHCDCRIELLKVAEERDAAQQRADYEAGELRRGALEREKQRIRTAQLRETTAALEAIVRGLAQIDPYILGGNAPYGCITCTWAEVDTETAVHEPWCAWRQAKEWVDQHSSEGASE